MVMAAKAVGVAVVPVAVVRVAVVPVAVVPFPLAALRGSIVAMAIVAVSVVALVAARLAMTVNVLRHRTQPTRSPSAGGPFRLERCGSRAAVTAALRLARSGSQTHGSGAMVRA